MKKSIVFILIALSCTLLSYDLPKDWFKAGSEPDKYEMGIDKGAGINGKNVATIRSTSKRINGFGTLMQNSSPEKYLGKRVRMSGYMRSENVNKWAGFWFRIDGADKKTSLGFDNMYDRAVTGTTAWTKFDIVLDVPSNAANLAYGALLSGTGQIWFDNINFDIVEPTTPATNIGSSQLKEPKNLNFED